MPIEFTFLANAVMIGRLGRFLLIFFGVRNECEAKPLSTPTLENSVAIFSTIPSQAEIFSSKLFTYLTDFSDFCRNVTSRR